MAVSDSAQNEGLVRVIGAGALGTSVINMVVGAGIFVLPGLVAAELGSAAIFAYLICSVTVALVFLCFAEVGSRVRAAAVYASSRKHSVRLCDSSRSCSGRLLRLADAAITVIMAIHDPRVSILGESHSSPFIDSVVDVSGICKRSGRQGGRSSYIFNTEAKLVPLLLLLGAGLFVIDVDNLAISEWPSRCKHRASTILSTTRLAGPSVRWPGRNQKPSGNVIFGSSNGRAPCTLRRTANSVTRRARARTRKLHQSTAGGCSKCSATGGKMLIAGASFQSMAASAATCWGGPGLRSSLATCQSSFKVHADVIAVIFFAIVVGVFALSGTFKYLAVVATGSLLLIDLGVSLAVLRLRQRDGLPKGGEFRLPFGPVDPLLSCAIVGWLLLQLPLDEAVTIAALVGSCVAIYVARSAIRNRGKK